MGFITDKKIVVNENFPYDVKNDENLRLTSVERKTLPTDKKDVTLVKNQNVAVSFDYVLKRLLQNDLYIEKCLEKTKNAVDDVLPNKLSAAFRYSGDYPPTNKIFDNRDAYEKMIDDHDRVFHPSSKSENVVNMDVLHERYLENDFSNFDEANARFEFQKKRRPFGDEIVENDVVVKMEFDDSPGVTRPYNYIQVEACNRRTEWKFKNSYSGKDDGLNLPSMKEIKYIYKEWLSGAKELYVYIPSTYTFFNEKPDEISPKDGCTFVRLKINRLHFPLNNIYGIDVCGQSLPLQVHDVDGNKSYDDVVLPSIVRTLCASNKDSNNVDCVYDLNANKYLLYFCCYGSDAQAVRIRAD